MKFAVLVRCYCEVERHTLFVGPSLREALNYIEKVTQQGMKGLYVKVLTSEHDQVGWEIGQLYKKVEKTAEETMRALDSISEKRARRS